MEERDLPTVDAWVCAEGWRPARKDMEAYYAADPRGLWVLVSKSEVADQEEKIIGINRDNVLGVQVWAHWPLHCSRGGAGQGIWQAAVVARCQGDSSCAHFAQPLFYPSSIAPPRGAGEAM